MLCTGSKARYTVFMRTRTRTTPRIQRRNGRKTLAELLRGTAWVTRQWEAARGLLKGRTPKDVLRWQRQRRQEWTAAR